jgi:hypothetical protein
MTMSDVTIVAARRPIGVQINAVFRDWSALSLIKPVVFVDFDALLPNGTVPVIVYEDGTPRTADLQEELGRRRVDVVRLCAVSLVDTPEGLVSEQVAVAVSSMLRDAIPSASLVLSQLVVGSPGADWAAASPILGWHNLALSPEDSQSPDRGISPLPRSADDPRWLFSVVGCVCSLMGLWPGQSSGVLEDRRPPTGVVMTPVRSYVRSLAAGAVEGAVAKRLFTFGEHYPTPRVDTGAAVIVDDEMAVAMGMADALLDKHPELLPRERVTPAPQRAQAIGFMAAMKQFFSFMLNAIKGAPRALADAMIRRASDGVARAVTGVVFGGADSGYTVVVRGVRADGSPVSWSQYESSLESVLRKSAASSQLSAPPQNPQVWSDYIDGAFTLLDAGNRSADLPPRSVGSQRAIVATTARVAPSPDDKFRLPPHLAAFLTSWEVEAADDIDAGRLYEELPRRVGSQAHLALDAGTERQRLKDWAARSGQSYVGRLGRRLGDAYRDLVKEVEGLNRRVDELTASATLPEDIGKQQEELASRIRVLAIVAVVILVTLGVLMGFGVIALLWAAIGLVVTLLGWFVGGTLIYLKGQQKLHHFLHRQGQRATDLETAVKHRTEALEDLRTLTRGYRQYLDWSRALSAFLHAPLGTPAEESANALVVGEGLPRSIGVGVALPDAEAVEEVANRWRLQLFQVNWLADAWEEFLGDVPASLGAIRHQIQSDPKVLFADQTLDNEGSVLSRWSKAVNEAAKSRAGSVTFLDRVKSLTESDTESRDRLLSRVMVRDAVAGIAREQSRADFNDGLDGSRGHLESAFLGGMFSPHALAVDIRSVKEEVRQTHSKGLDSAIVLVQFGGSYPANQFANPHENGVAAPVVEAVPTRPLTEEWA